MPAQAGTDLAGQDGIGKCNADMKEGCIIKGPAPSDPTGTTKRIIGTMGRYKKFYLGIHRQGTRTFKTNATWAEIYGAGAIVDQGFQGIFIQKFGKPE